MKEPPRNANPNLRAKLLFYVAGGMQLSATKTLSAGLKTGTGRKDRFLGLRH